MNFLKVTTLSSNICNISVFLVNIDGGIDWGPYYTVARRYSWILCSSGKNKISWVSTANEWAIVFASRT